MQSNWTAKAVAAAVVLLFRGPSAIGQSEPGLQKTRLLPWSAFLNENESQAEQRNYYLFANKFGKLDEIANPAMWRSFDPSAFDKESLVPSKIDSQKLGPLRYADAHLPFARDPGKNGVLLEGDKPVFIYAHQGTPTVNGWLAPMAGYAYEVEGTVIFGTTNYTPIDYNGSMKKAIDQSRIGVSLISQSGAPVPCDLSRMFFFISKDLTSRPYKKVYPALVYLYRGEKLSIEGRGVVDCPAAGGSTHVSIQSPEGRAADITISCLPDRAIVPGEVKP